MKVCQWMHKAVYAGVWVPVPVYPVYALPVASEPDEEGEPVLVPVPDDDEDEDEDKDEDKNRMKIG